jgi:hypothetical protein
MATGHPSFDVVNVGMHVQERLLEKARWMEELRPYIADAALASPDFDLADFSAPSMKVATGGDGRINVLPLNQDVLRGSRVSVWVRSRAWFCAIGQSMGRHGACPAAAAADLC